VEQGIKELEQVTPGFVKKLDEVIHGTTLVINSIIERKGAKTGLITTKGFRDVLELGREIRYAPYDVFAEFPRPLISRRFRLEVDERIRSDGTILKPLDPEEVRQTVNQLIHMGHLRIRHMNYSSKILLAPGPLTFQSQFLMRSFPRSENTREPALP
jgi:N-methylhydantoinase A